MKLRMLTAIFLLALPGCVSVLPEPEVPSGLYRLGDIEPSVVISRDLVVREPEGGRVYSGKAMAAVGDDGALRLIRGVEWSQPASRMLQTGLLDAIGTDGGGMALAKGTGAPGDLELAWRIADFTLEGRTARCEVQLTLLDGKTRKPLAQERIEAEASASSRRASDRAAALVEAARACVHESAEAIARADQTLARKAEEAPSLSLDQ